MPSFQHHLAFTSALVLSASTAACVTDSVPPDMETGSSPSQSADAAVDARKPTASADAGSGTKRDTGTAPDETDDDSAPSTGADAATKPTPAKDAGTSPPPTDGGGGAVDNGPCDLSGPWLITQHTSHDGLSVLQTGVWWYYYELEQSGADVTVKKGLVCGGKVIPGANQLVDTNVNWEPAWPATVEKNTQHTGRKGTVKMSGAKCSVGFETTWSVLGAAPASYYADESHALPTLDQEASGDTPGWEDWDNDNKPGVTLEVQSIVSGQRYVALRALNNWTSGTFAPGDTTIKIQAVADQQESILGVSDDLLNISAAANTDKTTQFAQFTKLDPDQLHGDDPTICADVRDLAVMLQPEANRN